MFYFQFNWKNFTFEISLQLLKYSFCSGFNLETICKYFYVLCQIISIFRHFVALFVLCYVRLFFKYCTFFFSLNKYIHDHMNSRSFLSNPEQNFKKLLFVSKFGQHKYMLWYSSQVYVGYVITSKCFGTSQLEEIIMI